MKIKAELQNNHISPSKNNLPDKSMRWISLTFHIRSSRRKIMRQNIFDIYMKELQQITFVISYVSPSKKNR